jgi:hypothetical protein
MHRGSRSPACCVATGASSASDDSPLRKRTRRTTANAGTRADRQARMQASTRDRVARACTGTRTRSRTRLPHEQAHEELLARLRATSAQPKRIAASTTSMNCGLKTRFVRRKSAGASAAIARPPWSSGVPRRPPPGARPATRSGSRAMRRRPSAELRSVPTRAPRRHESAEDPSGKYHTDSFVAPRPL